MAKRNRVITFTPITALATLLAVSLQLNGLLMMWKIHQSKQNDAIRAALLRKRNYSLRRLKLIKQRCLNRSKRTCWHKPGRTDLRWENIWTGIAPKECWKQNFRMSRTSFVNLVAKLRTYISPNPKSPNHRALSAEKKLATALYFLKDTGSLRMTANSFGIALNTASNVVTEVCQAISSYLGPKYLHLPKDEEGMREKVAEFEAKFGMTQAFGCIDGTHIPIKSPSENSQDFFCYKQFFSLSVQAVCDYKGMFMDVECRWPGSVHDAKVFANSSINAKLRNNKLPTTFQTPVPGGVKIPNYLIGDPAYPLLPFCMKEYETCASNEQVIFKNMLRSARNPIECAFGRLKARWAILNTKMDIKLDLVPTIIYVCFVLHNYCEKNNMYIDEDLVECQIECMKENEARFNNVPDPIYSSDVGEGSVVRRTLTELIQKNV